MINDSDFTLSEKNFIACETIKKQIVIGHTGTNKMKHYQKWLNRLNGKYKKTAAFTITEDGVIIKHFNPIYMSNLLNNNELDKKNIYVLLENEGWLNYDDEKKEYINWIGDIYNRPQQVIEKKWRGYKYWAPYTEKQLESTVELVNSLCEEFYITKSVISHNTMIDNFDGVAGVLYKSNFEKYYTDLSPAWDFDKFKNELDVK
jgi:hypothetical protein